MSLNNIDVNVAVPDVNGWFNVLNDYAIDAMQSANTSATQLARFSAPIGFSSTSFTPISTNVGIGAITKPKIPTISLGSRNLPSSPNITPIDLSLDAEPAFNVVSPSINLPNVPSPLDIAAPVKNFTIDTSPVFPVTPNTILPDVPSLLSLNIPTPDTIAIPIYDQTFPSSNSLLIPPVNFTFNELPYSDVLLTDVKNTLITRLQGGTGLNPTVENAIYNRGKDREARASLLAERTLLVERASSGFSRPTGAAMAALEQVTQETQSKLIDLSREIMIKQAELEQENIKTSIQQAISLEDILIREYNNVNQRSFEVAKYVQDVSIEITKLAINKYNSEVEAYKAFAVAYTSRVQAELAKVEIFKAKIDAEKLKGDINEQNIRIYIANLEGIKSNVEIYKALISAVSEKLKAESLKIEVYKADIDAYSTLVKSKAEEYGMYSSQVKGELAKVEVYDSQVKAFATRTQAYAASSEIKVKKAEVDTEIQSLNLKKYESDVNAFIKQVQADQLIYSSAVDLYKGETEMYLADASFGKAAAELSLKNSENTITQNKFAADIGIQNAQIAVEALKASYNATLEGAKAAGGIYQALSSSALSAIHVSANLSGQVEMQASESHSYSDK